MNLSNLKHIRQIQSHSRIAIALSVCLLGAACSSARAADLMHIYHASERYDAELQAAFHDLQVANQRVPLAQSTWRPQLSLRAESGINYRETDTANEDFKQSALSLAATQSLYNRANSTRVDQNLELLVALHRAEGFHRPAQPKTPGGES